MKPAIEIRNLGKQYALATAAPYLSIRDMISDSVKSIFKAKKNNDQFWALKDIDLDIQPGERIGIVGRNGAGKSTLLKIISRITPPTTGEVLLRGRVGSLLEVGTGFHPELSGRENIYLNGSILGLKKTEINRQLDAIISFSGIEKFIDAPLKHYSSGMQLRLAFSVAAHLEPEVLLIDEVLAVGDQEFQKKCIAKMEEVSKQHGRTILFVSHNLKAINDICQKAVFLEQGKNILYDDVRKVTSHYIASLDAGVNTRKLDNTTSKKIFIEEVKTFNGEKATSSTFTGGEKIGIAIRIRNNDWRHGFTISLGLNAISKGRVWRSQQFFSAENSSSSREFIAWLPGEMLAPGSFSIDIAILDDKKESLDFLTDALNFEIPVANTKFEDMDYDYGVISKEANWQEI
ncbi:MAG: ABC transporter ATP-binding protein [Chitinophagaceae bacterium]